MNTTATSPATSATTTWNIDPAHSSAEFKVKHMMISHVKGHFAKVTGSLTRGPYRSSLPGNTRRPARCAPQERRLLRRGEVPYPILQVHAHQPGPGRRTCGRRRSNRARHHGQGGLLRGRPNSASEGSLGQHPRWCISDHKDQPQRLRPDLECSARERRLSRRRRCHHHPRRAVRKGLKG
jgi:hypothetical protein